MSKLLITLGLAITAMGLAWPWLSRLPLGRLPGDISYQRDGFSFFLPLGSCILVSAVLSLLGWIYRRL